MRRRGADQGGNALVDFALILPLLMAFSLGLFEFTILMFDFHRAAEATRRGARLATISAPIAALDGLADGGEIVCSDPGGGITCPGGAVLSAETFDAIVSGMRAVFPAIDTADIEIIYSDSGIGDITTPGGIKPLITVSLHDVWHGFLLLRAVPGGPEGIDLPAFATSQLGPGYSTGL